MSAHFPAHNARCDQQSALKAGCVLLLRSLKYPTLSTYECIHKLLWHIFSQSVLILPCNELHESKLEIRRKRCVATRECQSVLVSRWGILQIHHTRRRKRIHRIIWHAVHASWPRLPASECCYPIFKQRHTSKRRLWHRLDEKRT